MSETVALVPMRHHSERVPGKNYRSLGDKPLFHHILQTLSACDSITQIVVDTDSEVIIRGVKEAFPHVTVIQRPQELRAGTVPMNEVIWHDIGVVESDYYLQTHSTNPFLKPETIAKAIRAFQDAYPERDSLFSVTRLYERLWAQDARPVNHDPAELLRTQDLAPIFRENSCIYIFDREGFLGRKNRIGSKPVMFEMDELEAWDIDEEIDFQLAELFLKLMRGGA